MTSLIDRHIEQLRRG